MLLFPTMALIYLGFLILAVSIVLGLFFRDPDRRIGSGVVSPADGRVMKAEAEKGGRYHVSIFMNVHNVHVNRMPWPGRILHVEHHPGGFVPAFNKDSDLNERVVVSFRTENGDWEVTQIAGAVARRIVPYIVPGQDLRKGERFGLIRFGSRVDLSFRMPKGMVLAVSPGQKVRAGVTDIAAPAGIREGTRRMVR